LNDQVFVLNQKPKVLADRMLGERFLCCATAEIFVGAAAKLKRNEEPG